MRILIINDQNRRLAPYNTLFERYSEKYWEVSIDELHYAEIWQERQPNLIVVMLPINARESQLIQAFQTQTNCGVLACCDELDIPALETALAIEPQAVLVHPVTEPQLMATLHLIRLSRSVVEEDKLQVLSSREREVLQFVLKGLTSKEIGQQLFVSMNTVNTHKRRIKEKLGVRRWVEVR
jgi:two-component system response regulator NreC